jgi:micrococcal nuclease
MNKIYLFLFCVIVSFYPLSAFSTDTVVEAKVVSVHDGDTVTVLDTERVSYKIRLAEIDAPESGQPYGQKSKQVLSELVFNQRVKVTSPSKDRYGRLIGYISLDGKDINEEMLQRGAAWVYRQYAKTDSYFIAEAFAKENKIGVWSLSEAEVTPPWEWRKMQKKVRDNKKKKEG